jgi:hypothetical protein
MAKDLTRYDDVTYEHKADMGETIGKPIVVYGWETVKSGVLEGRQVKCFLDCFEDEAAALAEYPTARHLHAMMQPTINLNDLPGEDDPVPGGMYPDDIGGSYDERY